jgi:hypothetical protein
MAGMRTRRGVGRRLRSKRADGLGRRALASATLALVATIVVGGAAFARPIESMGGDVTPRERTEGEKYANDYGYGNADEDVLSAGRTPQERSTHLALARLHRLHVLEMSSERTEGEKYANNYGYGNADNTVVDRGRKADAARWQAQADAYLSALADAHLSAQSDAVPTQPSAPAEPGVPWGVATITGSLILVAGIGALIIRNQRSRTAI